MQITVGCPCGSNYSFDEETVNGHLRFPVSCPNCGTDGTNMANEYIRKFISGELEREQQKANPWWRRLFSRGGSTAEGDTAHQPIRFGFGVVGAAVGAVAGFAGWFFIKRWTGLELGLVAWGIGGLVGFCTRFAAGGGSFGLAGVASAAAVVSIMGGQYWSLHQVVDQRMEMAVGSIYDATREYAQLADKASTDEQITTLLDDYGYRPADIAPGENPALCQKRLMPRMGLVFGRVMKKGAAPTLREMIDEGKERPEVTDSDIAAFRKSEQPAMRDFLKGKPSAAEFSTALDSMTRKNLSFNSMMMQSWSRYTLLWIFLGVITAYRLGYDKSETDFT